MKKRLYHGSENIIERPIFGYGKRNNDFGLGFYTTEDVELAKEWSVAENRDGYCNTYSLDIDGLNVLDLTSEDINCLTWLYILLKNRVFELRTAIVRDALDYLSKNFAIDYENYDLIIGYRADDSYFSFAEDFLNGSISYRQLSEAMRLGELGLQVVLKSKKTFDSLCFEKSEKVSSDVWFPKKYKRDKTARAQYFNTTKSTRQKGDIYITNIIDEEMAKDDPRLQ